MTLVAGCLSLTCSTALLAQTKDPKSANPAANPATASSPAATRALAAEETDLKRVLQERFPGLEVSSISKSPYFGLYEVFAGDQIIYTDAKVS
ncbi:MAG: disulfide isomerase DsbC N-terminal domain-containing protein, partial [Betaproteobacteria bacterium]